MSIFKRQTKTQKKSISFIWSSFFGSKSQREYEARVGDGRDSDLLMAPITWIAERMAECPRAVRAEGDETLDLANPAVRLLARPNEFYSGSDLIKALSIDYDIDGNAYALKIRNGTTRITALWYVPWYMMEPHEPDEGYIDYYEYSPSGLMGRAKYGKLRVAPEDVIHLRNGLDPSNIRKGMSNLRIMLRRIYTDEQIANYTASLLANMGVPGILITPADDATIAPEDAKAIKKKFKEEFSGERTGEPFVSSGAVKVEQFGFNPHQLDLSQLSDVPEERICAFLHIPASVIGFGTGLQQTKVGATMTEQRQMAYEDCIIPHQNTWCEQLDMQLLSEFDTNEAHHIVFDRSGVRCLRDDETKLNDRVLRQFTAGLITRGRALEKVGEESTPADDVYYLSMATLIVPKAQADGSSTDEPAQDDEPADQEPKGFKARLAPKVAKLLRRQRADYERYSKIQMAQLIKIFSDLGDQAGKAYERLTKKNVMKEQSDDELIAKLIAEELDYSALDYSAHFLTVAKSTFSGISNVLGLGVNLTAATEQHVLTMAGTRKGLLDLSQEAKDSVFSALQEGHAAGEGAAELAARIAERVSAGPWQTAETRAMVIARTETKYAQNRSSIEAYSGTDTITRLQVIDGQLPTSCERCIARNGRIVTFAEADEIQDDEHPNGTLQFAPIVE